MAVGLLATCNADKTWIGMESSTDASPSQQGMAVGAVEAKSPAAEAGLLAGDVVVAVDDAEVQRPLDFQRAMLDRKPGETLRLTVRRSGQPVELEPHAGRSAREASGWPDQPAWELLGVELKPIPPEEFRKSHQTRYRGGLSVTAVRPNSPAASQGIVPGDILVGMHIWETATPGQRRLHPQAARLRHPQSGEVLHPPRRRNALRLSAGRPRQDGKTDRALAYATQTHLCQ